MTTKSGDAAPKYRGVDVTVPVYHLALHLVTLQKLKDAGLLTDGRTISMEHMQEIVRLGEAAGYPKPAAEHLQQSIEDVGR
jgi:hypothetical protein